MARPIRKLPSFNAVAPGQVASVALPLTQDYTAVYLDLVHGAGSTAMTQANQSSLIEYVKLMLNGQTYWNISGANLVKLNNFYGIPAETGILPLAFTRPYMRDTLAEDNFRLGTANLRTATLEVKFSDTITSPVIEGYAEIHPRGQSPLGQFVKLEDTHYSAAAAAGIREISDLPVIGPGVGIKALHITSSAIDDVELKVNNTVFYEAEVALMKTQMDKAAFQTAGRTWQTGMTHLDFAGNRYSDIIDTTPIRDFRLRLNMSAASDFAVLHELVVGQPVAA